VKSELTPASLAWASAAVTLGLVVSGAAVDFREFGLSAVVVALALVFAAVGTLIASGHPANAIVAETMQPTKVSLWLREPHR